MNNYKSFKYKYKRAILSGIFKLFPFGLILSTLGLSAVITCQSNVASYSVSVSGYSRNGTSVSSYSRRPPGSKTHDFPYLILGWLGFFTISGGAFLILKSLYAYKSLNDFMLLKLPQHNPVLPKHPQEIKVPNKKITANKCWKCEKCQSTIRPGSNYFLYDSRFYGKMRYCVACTDLIQEELNLSKRQKDEFELALKAAQIAAKERDFSLFEKYFGFYPTKADSKEDKHVYKQIHFRR